MTDAVSVVLTADDWDLAADWDVVSRQLGDGPRALADDAHKPSIVNAIGAIALGRYLSVDVVQPTSAFELPNGCLIGARTLAVERNVNWPSFHLCFAESDPTDYLVLALLAPDLNRIVLAGYADREMRQRAGYAPDWNGMLLPGQSPRRGLVRTDLMPVFELV